MGPVDVVPKSGSLNCPSCPKHDCQAQTFEVYLSQKSLEADFERKKAFLLSGHELWQQDASFKLFGNTGTTNKGQVLLLWIAANISAIKLWLKFTP